MPCTHDKFEGSPSSVLHEPPLRGDCPAYVTMLSALPSWLSSGSTSTAPGPSDAPPGVSIEGAATKSSPAGEKRMTRASTMGVVVNSLMQNSGGTSSPTASGIGRSQNFVPVP